jgi:hypothetical protein
MSEPLQPVAFEAPTDPTPAIRGLLLDSPEAWSAGDPERQAFLGRLLMLPVTVKWVHDELLEQLNREDDPVVAAWAEHKFREEALTGKHYAWIQILRFLSHDRSTRKDTKGPVVRLDICSAVPLAAEFFRSLDFYRHGKYAKSLVDDYVGGAAEHIETEVTDEELLYELLKSKSWTARLLLVSNLQAVIHTLSADDFESSTPIDEIAADRLMFLSAHSRSFFRTAKDKRHYEGRMSIDTAVTETDLTLVEQLADKGRPTDEAIKARIAREERCRLLTAQHYEYLGKSESDEEPLTTKEARTLKRRLQEDLDQGTLQQIKEIDPLGTHRAADLIYKLCRRLCREALDRGMLRPTSTISVDIADPTELVQAAPESFLYDMRRSGLYRRTLIRLMQREEVGQHIRADVLDPAFWATIKDDSITHITCIEGFMSSPGTGAAVDVVTQAANTTDDDGTLDRLSRHAACMTMFDKLKENGHMLFFRWGGNVSPDEQAELEDIIKDLQSKGAKTTIVQYRRDILMAAMESSTNDTSLIGISPVFDIDGPPDEQFKLLLVQKETGSLLLAKRVQQKREMLKTPG